MERKEPTISSGIKPDKEEVAARQSRKPAGERPPGGAPPKSPPHAGSGGGAGGNPPPPPIGAGGQGLAVAALLVALLAVAAGGFLGWQGYQSQQALAYADERLANLERRIDITSNESSEYVEEIQEKLQWADSEIRKLWGVSHDTNRKRIAANQQSVDSLKSGLSDLQKTASSTTDDVERLRSTFETVRTRLTQVSGVVEELQEATGSVENQARRLQNLSEEVDQLNDQLANLGSLAGRVDSNEEAIQAIDDYRRSINRDILSIKEQLSTLSP